MGPCRTGAACWHGDRDGDSLAQHTEAKAARQQRKETRRGLGDPACPPVPNLTATSPAPAGCGLRSRAAGDTQRDVPTLGNAPQLSHGAPQCLFCTPVPGDRHIRGAGASRCSHGTRPRAEVAPGVLSPSLHRAVPLHLPARGGRRWGGMGQDFLPLVPPRGLSDSPGCSLPSWQLPPNSWGLDPGWFPAPRIHPLSPAVPWLVTAPCPEPRGDPWPTHRGIRPWGHGQRAAGLGDIPSAQGTPGCGAHNHECPTALLGGTGTLWGYRRHAGQWGHNHPGSWHHISSSQSGMAQRGTEWHSTAWSGTVPWHGTAQHKSPQPRARAPRNGDVPPRPHAWR